MRVDSQSGNGFVRGKDMTKNLQPLTAIAVSVVGTKTLPLVRRLATAQIAMLPLDFGSCFIKTMLFLNAVVAPWAFGDRFLNTLGVR